jgi:hypothetical protein
MHGLYNIKFVFQNLEFIYSMNVCIIIVTGTQCDGIG